MTTLIFVRHGQSEANVNNIYAGFLDAELTELGKEQAERTAEYIVKNYKIDKIYSSDLKRAYSTAMAVANKIGLEIITDKRLREINGGNWEGKLFDSLRGTKEYELWLSDIGNSACVGGESVKQLQERIVCEIEKIISENNGKTVLIATHATPIRVMQCAFSGAALDEMKNIPWVSNASVTVVCAEDGRYDFKLISYDKHLGDMKTVLPSNV